MFGMDANWEILEITDGRSCKVKYELENSGSSQLSNFGNENSDAAAAACNFWKIAAARNEFPAAAA